MKHLLKRVSAANSKVIAHIKMGDDIFNIISRDSGVYGMFRGCDILNCGSFTDHGGRVANVIKDFIGEYLKGRDCHSLSVLRDKNANDLDSLLEQLKGIPGIKKVMIKTIPEDMTEINKSMHPEFSIERAVDYQALAKSLRGVSIIISDMTNTLNVCRADALTLTQGRLVNTMWGADSMQRMISDLHDEIAENSAWDKVEFFSSLIVKSIDRLIHKLFTNLIAVCDEERKMICTVLIPNILSNYEQLKKVISSALVSLSSLIYVDMMFKEKTSYPAAWFMNGSMLEDLKQDYQKILGFMMLIPRIEQEIIYPLDFLKLQHQIG